MATYLDCTTVGRTGISCTRAVVVYLHLIMQPRLLQDSCTEKKRIFLYLNYLFFSSFSSANGLKQFIDQCEMAVSNYNIIKKETDQVCSLLLLLIGLVWFMVFYATFNNISVMLWWSILFVEETRVPGECTLIRET